MQESRRASSAKILSLEEKAQTKDEMIRDLHEQLLRSNAHTHENGNHVERSDEPLKASAAQHEEHIRVLEEKLNRAQKTLATREEQLASKSMMEMHINQGIEKLIADHRKAIAEGKMSERERDARLEMKLLDLFPALRGSKTASTPAPATPQQSATAAAD